MNWDYVQLGDISFITKLAGFEYTKYIKYQDQGDIIMIRGLNCKGTKLVLDDIKWIDKETSDLLPRSKLSAGDIVITYVGTVGEIGLIDKDNTYHLAPNVAKLCLDDKKRNNPSFWAYMLMFSRDYVIRFATSTTQAALNMDKIRKIGFIDPPADLQEQFVAILEQTDKSKFVAYQETFFIEKILKYTYNHTFRRKNNVH
jgi:type I restriction enzyme S subunit